MVHRRHFMVSSLATSLVFVRGSVSAQETVDQAELLKPGPLPDKVMGSPDAPVTVIEYASLTCHHCQNFHKTTWPSFKAKYVDTGKVRFIIREFPLDPLATAGFMLARCAGEDKWYPVVDMLYQTGEAWNHADKPYDALVQVMRQTGMGRETVEACLRDEKIYNGIRQVADRATQSFKVDSTPTFFINGRKEVGALSLDRFEKILEPLLAAKP